MSKPSTILCSCIVCKQVKSNKGIHSHYLLSHTEEGRQKNKIKKINQSAIAKRKAETDLRKINYLSSPAKCSRCNISLSYPKRNNTFCSTACAATVNNQLRNKDSREQQRNTLIDTLNSKPKFTKIDFRVCKNCKAPFIYSKIHNMPAGHCSVACKNAYMQNFLSQHAKRIGFGGVRPSCKIKYNGVTLGSSYEVRFAIILDSLQIQWTKPKRVPYIDHLDKHRTYEPDFYLPKYNIYIDTKNDFLIHNINPRLQFKDIDKIAWAAEQNSITVAIIDNKNITEGYINKLVGQEGFEPSVILSCKDSGIDHSHHCPILYL